ncbi:MAG: hypothetical protein AB7P76_12610 [Candidatus Melainabacteria bacterium]
MYRRIAFGIAAGLALLPFLPAIIRGFRQSGYYGKVAIGFLAFSLLIRLIPGGYFPPFNNGIGGWTLDVKSKEPMLIAGIKLFSDTQAPLWFSNCITLPQSFLMRQHSSCMKQGEKPLKQCLGYYQKLYAYNYPSLREGYFASQRLLRNFSYPGHNPCRFLPGYKTLKPEQIREIAFVTERFDRKSLALLKEDVFYRFNVPLQQFTYISPKLRKIWKHHGE